MAMEAEVLKELIQNRLPDATVEIRDLAGDGDHYAATIISEEFAGLNRVQRHRLIYEALGESMEIGGALHALALTALTPDQAT